MKRIALWWASRLRKKGTRLVEKAWRLRDHGEALQARADALVKRR